MKAFIVLAAVVSANAGVLLSSGSSVSQRSEDGLGNYAFGYDEKHSTGGSFRKESGSPGIKVGSYGLSVIDGRQRVVNYVADGAGFRATISTNEQGTAPSLPAAAAYNAAPAVTKVAVAAAPVLSAASYAAPLSIAAPAIAAPVLAAPIGVAKSTSYASAVNHGAIQAAPIAIAAPAVASYAAPIASIPAPAIYAANVFAPSGAKAW